MVLVFDIGGTSTKFAILNKKREFIDKGIISYPNNELIESDDLLILIKKQISISLRKIFLNNENFDAICFSSCGIIANNGNISGLSAIKNYSKINWKRDLKEFQMPVFVENDANCALLAEYRYGLAMGKKSVVSIVLGTGIGGAIIINNQLLKGLSGEFGCFFEKWENDKCINFSVQGSPRNVQERLNKEFQENKNLENYMKEYESNKIIKSFIDEMIFTIAKNIVNITFTIDPELFIIGGAISSNSWFIKKVYEKVNELICLLGFKNKQINIAPAYFENAANILGAYSLYEGGEQNANTK